jgi:MFS transporter, PHS family, inorganic phosphate transporter
MEHPKSYTTSAIKEVPQYGAILGEQYFIPIEFGDGSSRHGSTTSTVASSESDSLLGGPGHVSGHHSRLPSISDDTMDSDGSCFDSVYYCLGFESNPMRSSEHITRSHRKTKRNSAAADLQLSMLSNFSTAYNVICISLALQMIQHVSWNENDDPMYTISPKDESICSSALIAGMILGQLTLGTLGDVLGRHRAMSVVMLLQIVASFGSAFSYPMRITIGNSMIIQWSIFEVLAAWRFLLGLGCGGVYPLAATLTTESSESGRDRAKLVALTFSFQGVGYLVVPAIAYIIVSILDESSDFGWRLLLGLGSVPGAVLTVGRHQSGMQQRKRRREQSMTQQNLDEDELEKPPQSVYVDLEAHLPTPKARAVPVSIVDAISLERNLIRKLLGTAGSWLLFDVLFYGNSLFQPVVLSAAFGTSETVAKLSRDSFLLALMALPGYFVSIVAVSRQSPRWIQLQGFFIMGMLYLTIGVLFDLLSEHSVALLIVYGTTFFFSNYGPNATTFMLPSMTFSKSCRSTLNGICAACGKAGALMGATVFVAACHEYGQKTVFLMCALVSFIGCLLTLVCVSGRLGNHEDEEEHEQHLERTLNQLGLGRRAVPMKMVYSHPSIFDSFPTD